MEHSAAEPQPKWSADGPPSAAGAKGRADGTGSDLLWLATRSGRGASALRKILAAREDSDRLQCKVGQNLRAETRPRFSAQSVEHASNAVLEAAASRYVHPPLNLCVLGGL